MRDNLRKELDYIIKDLKNKYRVGIFMDFDKCANDMQLSPEITRFYRARCGKDFVPDNTDEFSYINSLFSLYENIRLEDFDKTVNQLITNKLKWRKGFLNFSEYIASREDILPMFVSSGVARSARMALDMAGVKIGVFACELDIKEDVILGARTIVTGEDKADVVNYIKDHIAFDRVVTLGHSSLDVPLILSGDNEYRLSFDDDSSAKDVADVVIQDWDWNEVMRFCYYVLPI